jgi:hypothetical protein
MTIIYPAQKQLSETIPNMLGDLGDIMRTISMHMDDAKVKGVYKIPPIRFDVHVVKDKIDLYHEAALILRNLGYFSQFEEYHDYCLMRIEYLRN